MNKSMYSVSSLNRYIKQLLDNDLNVSSILVKGEVSNFTNHRSGHWYFSLKDRHAKIACIMFASYACKSKILLKEGMQVIVHASLSMYEAQGSCQLFVTRVEMDGIGDLYMELEDIKERMRKENYFSLEHKKALPPYPMHIGIVTAKTGAAIQDMLSTIARRWPLADVEVFPTSVQGVQASSKIIDALQQADEKDLDVILLGRGGGAIEDLWCFNNEELAKCIYHMKTPIVTGVGHETDTTLVDYVSDMRAPTPTAAAERITPNIEECKERIYQYRLRLLRAASISLQQHRHRLYEYQTHRYLIDPLSYTQHQRMLLAMHIKGLDTIYEKVHRHKSRSAMLTQRLSYAAQQRLNDHVQHMQHMEYSLIDNMKKRLQQRKQLMKEDILLLDAFSPLKILGRGYAIARKDHTIIHHVHELSAHDRIELRLQDGVVEATVEDVKGMEQ